jgi:DNA-directed RNA polymerase specialized sigma subunit
MSEPSQLDRTFQIIMKYMMETGQAPHYTEIASELNVTVEEGRKALHLYVARNFCHLA